VKVTLAAVVPADFDVFYARFDSYRRELDAFDACGPDTLPLARYREAHAEDGCDRWWLLANGERSGLAIVRVVADWPDDRRQVAEILDLGVDGIARRRGVGRAAVEALRAHYRGTVATVEASILAGNDPALAFWAALGFLPRAIQTSREP